MQTTAAGQQVGAAGMPNFYPYSANNATQVTELSQLKDIVYALAPPSHVV